MPTPNEMFPSPWLRAADLNEKENSRQTVTITGIKREDVGGDLKWAIHFKEQKPLILNRTNCKRLEQFFGSNTDAWIGKRTELYVELVDFKGETKEGVRVHPIRPAAPKKAATPAPVDELNDDINF